VAPDREPVFKKFDSIGQHDDDCRQDDGSKRERMALQPGLAMQLQSNAVSVSRTAIFSIKQILEPAAWVTYSSAGEYGNVVGNPLAGGFTFHRALVSHGINRLAQQYLFACNAPDENKPRDRKWRAARDDFIFFSIIAQ
jgi:hypothetical protein